MKKELLIDNSQTLFDFLSFAKGFSIICIVLFHLLHDYMTATPNAIRLASIVGGTGVHMFFVASGIGLYYSYLSRPTNACEFFKRRFYKIYVPYIIIVFISFMVPWYYQNLDSRVGALLSHVFLYKMFIPQYEMSFGGQLWFVSTIIQFYIVFLPLCYLYKKLRRNSLLFFAIAMCSSVIWWVILFVLDLGNVRIWNSFFLQFLWEFVLGMIIANHIYRDESYKLNITTVFAMAILGIGVEGVTGIKGGILTSFNDIFCTMGFLGVITFVYLLDFKWLKKQLIRLTSVSYELYLVHILIFNIAFRYVHFNGGVGQLLFGVFVIAICIVVSSIYSRFINAVIRLK